jgi:hypothetical protein
MSLTLLLLCRDDSFHVQIVSQADICEISRNLVENQLSTYKAGVSFSTHMSGVVADTDRGGYAEYHNFSFCCIPKSRPMCSESCYELHLSL